MTIVRKLGAALFLGTLTFTVTAISAESVSESLLSMDHPFFDIVRDAGAEVSQPADLPVVEGLHGYQIKHPESSVPAVVYLSADGEVVVSGQFMTRDGRDPIASYITQKAVASNPAEVTERFNEKLREAGEEEVDFSAISPLPKTAESVPVNQGGDPAWVALEGSLYFERLDADLESDRIVYVFIDPNCPRCAQFWPTMETYAEKGLNFRVVPVSFLQVEDGINKIVAMAMTQDPYAAMAINETLFDRGGFPAAATVSVEASDMIMLNLSLMEKLGVPGTPGIVFQDEMGRTQVVQELSERVLQVLAGAEQ